MLRFVKTKMNIPCFTVGLVTGASGAVGSILLAYGIPWHKNMKRYEKDVQFQREVKDMLDKCRAANFSKKQCDALVLAEYDLLLDSP